MTKYEERIIKAFDDTLKRQNYSINGRCYISFNVFDILYENKIIVNKTQTKYITYANIMETSMTAQKMDDIDDDHIMFDFFLLRLLTDDEYLIRDIIE